MLVLNRALGQKIMIGSDIVVTVVRVERGKCRLAVEAPLNVPIYRSELLADDHPPVRPSPIARPAMPDTPSPVPMTEDHQ